MLKIRTSSSNSLLMIYEMARIPSWRRIDCKLSGSHANRQFYSLFWQQTLVRRRLDIIRQEYTKKVTNKSLYQPLIYGSNKTKYKKCVSTSIYGHRGRRVSGREGEERNNSGLCRVSRTSECHGIAWAPSKTGTDETRTDA